MLLTIQSCKLVFLWHWHQTAGIKGWGPFPQETVRKQEWCPVFFFFSGMLHYECIAPYIDISFTERGSGPGRLLRSVWGCRLSGRARQCSATWYEDAQVFQLSGGGALRIILHLLHHSHVQCAQIWWVIFTHVTLASTCISCHCVLSVTCQCPTQTAKRRMMQTTPHHSPGTLVFWCRNSRQNSKGWPQWTGGTKCRWGKLNASAVAAN